MCFLSTVLALAVSLPPVDHLAGELSGLVLAHDTLEGIEDALVVLCDAFGEEVSTSTDRLGSFHFAAPVAFPASVRVGADEYTTCFQRYPDARHSHMPIVLYRARTIRGKIEGGSSGTIFCHSNLRGAGPVLDNTALAVRSSVLSVGTLEANGQFEVAVPAGLLALEVRLAGAVARVFGPSSSPELVTFAPVSAMMIVKGKIQDAKGDPLPRCAVSARVTRLPADDGKALQLSAPHWAVSDSAGMFALSGLPEEACYVVRIERVSFRTLERAETSGGTTNSPRVYTLSAAAVACSIPVQVTDSLGNPVRGARVRSYSRRPSLQRPRYGILSEAFSGGDGKAGAGFLEGSLVVVRVDRVGFSDREVEVTTPTPIVVTLESMRRFGGRIVTGESSLAVAGALIYGDPSRRLVGRSDARGGFVLRHDGEEAVVVVADGFRLQRCRLPLPAEQPIVLEACSPVEGRVQDSDGTPLNRALVIAEGHRGGYRHSVGSLTDADGVFRLSGVRAGRLVCHARSYYPSATPLDASCQDLVLVLDPCPGYRGRVAQPSGRGAGSVEVSLRDSETGLSWTATTDERGAFSFESAPRGEAVITVSRTAPGLTLLPRTFYVDDLSEDSRELVVSTDLGVRIEYPDPARPSHYRIRAVDNSFGRVGPARARVVLSRYSGSPPGVSCSIS